MTQMQGIVSILRSDNLEKTPKAASLRRTLSADMSSKRWLAESGMKKIASSEQIMIDFSHSSSSDSSDEEECDQANENPKRMDIWTAIMSQKKQDDSAATYVHPLMKSARSLSEKSLKVCTESLGSETGSDVFSFASSNPSEEKQEQEQSQPQPQQPQQQQQQKPDEPKVAKPAASLLTKKGQQARSFPPPLPSLAAAHTDSPSLHMHSRRVDGRLVLEAVSVPPQKYFEAQRQDGRFLLTLINDEKEQQPSLNEFVDVFNVAEEEKIPNNDYYNNDEYSDEDETEIDVNNKDIGIIKQRRPLNSPTGVINVHKSTITIKKITERDNMNINNLSWSRNLNTKLSKLEIVDEEEEPHAPIVQSLPRRPTTGLPPLPRQRPPTATSVNSYQYFWKTKPSVASVIDPLITQHRPPTKTKDLVLLRGNKADCLLPSFKGCKEPRRSLMMWEPFCIATS